MKLENPFLSTSFYINDFGKIFYVYRLMIICDYILEFSYLIYGKTYEETLVYLGMKFKTPEEAFAFADKICSTYPRIGSDDDFYYLDQYPEFHKEVF